MNDVRSPVAGRGDRLRGAVRGFGELLVTLGLVVLLFVFYEVYVTDFFSAQKQADATAALDEQWARPPATAPAGPPVEGDGLAKLHVPAFGPDFVYTVLEGTGEETLSVGPGHYVDTAAPGVDGNFAVAGHRVGKGAPFNDLHLLESCDALVVETRQDWFVYRVLPMSDEVTGWPAGRGAEPQCRGVVPLPGSYSAVVGQEIVAPSQGEVIDTVPGLPGVEPPPDQRAALITLTTCHPRFSARQRLIIHGSLVAQYPKNPDDPSLRPAELAEG